jgi:DNA-binding NtrC family response regulator
MSKINLEEKIKEKVSNLLEETMEKHWGITIPKIEEDLTGKLSHPQINIYVPLNLSFSAAKKFFKAEFLKRELRLHKCNISQLAKILDIDRRSVHRVIKNLGVDVEELRKEIQSIEDSQTGFVDHAIRSTLDQYKEVIQPQKMEKMYEEVHELSRNIAKILPHQELSWKEAEKEFEKQFLNEALKESKGVVTKAASKLKIRVETLHRKIKRLGLER